MSTTTDQLPPRTPGSVLARLERPARIPVTDPTLNRAVRTTPRGQPRHRLVVLGDSLSQGVQSGAVFRTDLSWPAIVARELGWPGFRYPRYPGVGGLPLNIELIARELDRRFGSRLSWWELPQAFLHAQSLMDRIEDHWERGPGSRPDQLPDLLHALAVLGWDLRDVLAHTASSCRAAIGEPSDQVLPQRQLVEHVAERAALRVYPDLVERRGMTLLDMARELGAERDVGTDAGIETLVVMLGSNNCLGATVDLAVRWSGPQFADASAKAAYNVWDPLHFAAELGEVATQVRSVAARHVIWATVPHVTVAPVARGLGGKDRPGSRYFRWYARPWQDEARFEPGRDPHLIAAEARAIDLAIDGYNEAITAVVDRARAAGLDWYLLDLSGMLDRLAARRFGDDPSARPAWWTPYPLPAGLAGLDPVPDTRFLLGDEQGRRIQGGLFSLDGVHPTTVGYGLIAQEMIGVMELAGVEFRTPDGVPRPPGVRLDFGALAAQDTLLQTPPRNLGSIAPIIRWGEQVILRAGRMVLG